MSALSDAARAAVLICDHASVDAAQKLTLVGGGWMVSGVLPQGTTAPMAVVWLIDIPAEFHGQSAPVSMCLVDDIGDPVTLPGQPGPMRIAQVVKIERPNVPGQILPDDFPARVQGFINIPMGLPLQPGKRYTWELEIDSNKNPQWAATFFLLGAPPAPVIG